MISSYSFSIVFISFLCGVKSYPLVNTTHGLIEGKYFKTWSGRIISAFLGIPYAVPLEFKKQFRNAKMFESWNYTYQAKEYGEQCVQMTNGSFLPSDVPGDDDCLYLNIYTPDVSNTSKLEVIFFIHGGGFMLGNGNKYTPYFLLDRHNVVFVSINYRLGPLGFLSTEDDKIPGNFGLKDQVLALRWVRKNINNFGGDKNKITLMGENAGAASVHLHYMSPMSRSMFKQGISLGGSALCPWVLSERPRSRAQSLAKKIRCPDQTSKGILKCLRKFPRNLLMDKVRQVFFTQHSLPFSPFGPVIEKKTQDSFLNDHPYKIIQEKKFKDAPWLVGLTSHEGLYFGAKFTGNHVMMEEIDENWHKVAPVLLNYLNTVPSEMRQSVSEKIRQFYFEEREISVTQRKQFIAMLGDRFFVSDTDKAVRLQASASKSSIFLYRFGYKERRSKAFPLCNCTEIMGAGHGDDLLYLFKTPGFNVTETKHGEALMRQMVDIIISFTKNEYPKVNDNTVWKPVNWDSAKGNSVNLMEILESQNINLKTSFNLGNHRFWSSLHLSEFNETLSKPKNLSDEL